MAIVDSDLWGRTERILVDADPSGVTTAKIGSIAFLNTGLDGPWINLNNGTSWRNLTVAAGGGPTTFDWSGGAAITTGSAASGGGTATADEGSFFDLGCIHRLKVVANGNTTDIDIELFADAAHAVRLYFADGVDAYTSAWDDRSAFHYRDDDGNQELHYKITNNGLNASTFTVTVQAIGE